MSSLASVQGKRRRIATACTHCRSRRTRCDGVYPRCGPCLNLGFDCSFASTAGSDRTPVVVRREDYDNLADRLRKVERNLAAMVDGQVSANDQAPSKPHYLGTQTRFSEYTSGKENAVEGSAPYRFCRQDPEVTSDNNNKLLSHNLSLSVNTAADAAICKASAYNLDANARPSARILPAEARILPAPARVYELIDIWVHRLSRLYPIIQTYQIHQYYNIAIARDGADIPDTESEAQLGLLNAIFMNAASTQGCWEEAAGYYQIAGLLLSDAGDLGHQDTLSHGRQLKAFCEPKNLCLPKSKVL